MSLDEKQMLEDIAQHADEVSVWERGFLESCMKRTAFSFSQKGIILRLYNQYVVGQPQQAFGEPVVVGNVEAIRQPDGGWLVHVNGKATGCQVTRKEAMIVVPWMASTLSETEQLPIGPLEEEGSSTIPPF